MIVIKRNGYRESFDKNKLKAGLLRACEKRPIPTDKIEDLSEEIENYLRTLEKNEINSKKIGSLVLRKLKKLDKVAYIRFASVYLDFCDLDAFEKELKKLQK